MAGAKRKPPSGTDIKRMPGTGSKRPVKASSSGGLKVTRMSGTGSPRPTKVTGPSRAKGVGPVIPAFGGMLGAAMGTKKAGAAKAMATARVNVTKATGGVMRSAGRQGMKAPPKSPVKPTYRSPRRGDNGN